VPPLSGTLSGAWFISRGYLPPCFEPVGASVVGFPTVLPRGTGEFGRDVFPGDFPFANECSVKRIIISLLEFVRLEILTFGRPFFELLAS